MERIWKDTFVAYLSYYSGMWVEGLRKAARTSVPVAGVLADI
jgi:hypothetical protein